VILDSQRSHFEMPRQICYLNAAYMTPFPKSFGAIGGQSISDGMHPWDVTPRDFFTRSENLRSLAAQVMDADSDSVALVPAVSYAVATAAHNLPVEPGQVILTLAEEFPSNYYGWSRLAKEVGAEVHVVPGPADRDWTAALLEAIDGLGDRVAIVAAPHIHWSTGSMLDLFAIRRATRKVGAALFCDLTQSLGALPLSVGKLDPDFAVAAGYKWLFGPYAVGYLYVSPRWQAGAPLEDNWIVRAGSEDFGDLVNYREDYQPGARRYDMGERSNFLALPLAEAGLDTVLGWGIASIAETLGAINATFAGWLEEAGFRCVQEDRRAPHLMATRPASEPSAEVAARWKRQGVLTSQRGDWIRIAPHLWVDDEDMERFRAAIKT